MDGEGVKLLFVRLLQLRDSVAPVVAAGSSTQDRAAVRRLGGDVVKPPPILGDGLQNHCRAVSADAPRRPSCGTPSATHRLGPAGSKQLRGLCHLTSLGGDVAIVYIATVPCRPQRRRALPDDKPTPVP